MKKLKQFRKDGDTRSGLLIQKSIAVNFFFNEGKKCSWHYHKDKDETFYLQSGQMYLTYGDSDDVKQAKTIVLREGDKFHIYRGLRHQMTAITDVEVFEFSTQHFDEDSIRIVQGD